MLPAGVTLPQGRIKPWGTGQATLLCQDIVNGPFAVINADDFYGQSSFQALYDHLVAAKDCENAYDFCMVGYTLGNTMTENGHVARGVCTVDQNNDLIGIRERTRIERFGQTAMYTEDDGTTWVELPINTTVSMNMWGFTPGIFDELEASFQRFFNQNPDLQKAEFFLPAVVNELLEKDRARVKVIPTRERWAGVTYQADRPTVEAYIAGLFEAGLYPEKLWD